MKVFWFFFSKKNEKKALLFEKRSKNFYPSGRARPEDLHALLARAPDPGDELPD